MLTQLPTHSNIEVSKGKGKEFLSKVFASGLTESPAKNFEKSS